ncbi:unnamed protein product [Adineta steineri]|uniref:Uncharacterized protein n=1 Tax=Adineta steineri TaxID=433720 RepID=A0A813XVG6_9BILA|nr:unnamed protein product [Adineta steineri]CAF0914588.1 unnamed protein product [Adineta steineri]
MHPVMRIDSREDLQIMNNSYSYQSTNSLHQISKQNDQQIKATIYYERDRSSTPLRPPSPMTIPINNNNERTKSVDHLRTLVNETVPKTSTPSSTSTSTSTINTSHVPQTTNRTMGIRSSTAYINELHKPAKEGEKRELNTLNNRFENYLDKIKNLVNANTNLRRQVNDVYRKYIGHTQDEEAEQQTEINDNKQQSIKKYQHPSEIQLNSLRKKINEEVHAQSLLQIRLQRADFDINFYQNNMKLLTSHDQKHSEQIRHMRQQLEINLQELEHLKRQYERQEQDLQTYKSHFNEYMNKLIELSNEYDTITYERMENENSLYTLREQLSFEQEFYERRQQEFEYLEKIQHDLNTQFNQNEFHNIVKQIRQDYQEFHRISLDELEILYKTKLDTIQNELLKRQEQQQDLTKTYKVHTELDSTKKEHQTLIEENQLLKDKLEQLQDDLHNIIEQNRQRYELSDREYKQLQSELPELDGIIVQIRENAVNLWSEISTYRYLLVNLLSSTNEKPQKQISKSSSIVTSNKPIPIEKYTTTEKINKQESKNSIPMINKVTTTTTTKVNSYPQQYRDETTGFVVHIDNGIIWVRI